jgi:hypothetical protein
MSSSATDRLSTTNPRRVLVEPTPVVSVRFADGRVYLAMQDGREIGAPLEQFPRLATATGHATRALAPHRPRPGRSLARP